MSYDHARQANQSDQTRPLNTRYRPWWVEELETFYRGRIARQFVLHFNLTDFIVDTTQRISRNKGQYLRGGDIVPVNDPPEKAPRVYTMREYLYNYLFDGLRCAAVYTYSLAGGLRVEDRPASMGQTAGANTPDGRWQASASASAKWSQESSSSTSNNAGTTSRSQSQSTSVSMELLQEAARTQRIAQPRPGQRGQPEEGAEVDLPESVAESFKLLGHLLRQKHNLNSPKRTPPTRPEEETPIAVVLDYAEKLIPYHLGEGQGDRDQLQALEVVQRWSLDPLIRDTMNLVILLTDNIGLIPASVYAEGSGCRAIRIPLPEEGEREAFIYFTMTMPDPRRSLVPLNSETFGATKRDQAHRLARATQGMRLTDIDNVSRRIIIEYRRIRRENPQEATDGPLLGMEDVQRAKAEAIEAQSAQLLEIVQPVRGFNEIGGLEKLKQYLRERTALMLRGEFSPLVPSGLLLAGPPGTGKTIIAEALAYESGFNLVKMRNIQDKWIGSSERNLELVMNLLKDLHPVVVFIDEIDQAMARRDTGQSGDSGVGARMFARILEEMSNAENRGRILWVAATNRADMIDAALLRRFDRVVPLLTPDIHESCRIFATMLSTIMKQSGGLIKVAYGNDLEQSGNQDLRGRPEPTPRDLEKFLTVAEHTSGAGLTGAGIEIIVRRAIEMAYMEQLHTTQTQGNDRIELTGLPLIEARHLHEAADDFKPNYNRGVYEYQSLLALRACNFYSVIPELPQSGVYGRIQKDGKIDPSLLEQEIEQLELNYGLKTVNT
jgi:SpoVK/Ycf46/Vps4 family AAA+-type ATPase